MPPALILIVVWLFLAKMKWPRPRPGYLELHRNSSWHSTGQVPGADNFLYWFIGGNFFIAESCVSTLTFSALIFWPRP